MIVKDIFKVKDFKQILIFSIKNLHIRNDKYIFAVASEKQECFSKKGRLAQLVQSTSFTPRGSGVRVSHRPQIIEKPAHWSGLF